MTGTSLRMTKQHGFLMPMAIFIVLVMGGMALTISRYTSQASVATIQEVMNVQAFYAAESGAQYGMNQLFYDTLQAMTQAQALANCDALDSPNPPDVITFTGSGLDGCTASVSCSSNDVSGVNYFTITSVGVCGAATPFSAQRTIEVDSFIE
jgi:MSHA biogenesis protein MshP